MRLLLISIFIAAGLTLGGVSSFANGTKTETNTREITLMGQINDIEGDSLVVKDSRGTIHIVIPAAPLQLERARVGDNVIIGMRNRRAAVIHNIKNMGGSEGMEN
ncbi:MAG: hypothetical protein C4291_02745 [Candidatus Dadabacteria bacterium]